MQITREALFQACREAIHLLREGKVPYNQALYGLYQEGDPVEEQEPACCLGIVRNILKSKGFETGIALDSDLELAVSPHERRQLVQISVGWPIKCLSGERWPFFAGEIPSNLAAEALQAFVDDRPGNPWDAAVEAYTRQKEPV